jgi:UDP-N-acetylglucosamine 2-epimerase (non-hydrolysing)
MKTILTIIGTRPEAIKLAPVLHVLNQNKTFKSQVCITRQHADLLDPLFSHLAISVDYDLESPPKECSIHQCAAFMLEKLGSLLTDIKPDLVLVQGDTTTAFAGALAAYYSKIPVGHVEAGLRTDNLFSPWPEEGHRCLIDQLTTYFFAPTPHAFKALLAVGVPSDKIWVVGNTSIDAIRLAHRPLSTDRRAQQRMILVTVHRRENHGEALKEICTALQQVAEQYSDVRIIFFLHPNPAIHLPVKEMLSGLKNIELQEPIDHQSFVRLLDECIFIVSDSGGIQEEAPFMGKPILIPRDTTERPEGVRAGTARLVGTRSDDLLASCKDLLENTDNTLAAMSKVHYPYGDGYAAERIVNILETKL